jgi:hypothetical protein
MDISKVLEVIDGIIVKFDIYDEKHDTAAVLIDAETVEALYIARALIEGKREAYEVGYSEAVEKMAFFMRDEMGAVV